MLVWHLLSVYGSLLVCDLLLADDLLMVCCLFVVVLNLLACYGFHGQFPRCVGARPAVGEARRVALSLVLVVNLNVNDTLGDAGRKSWQWRSVSDWRTVGVLNVFPSCHEDKET